MHLRHATEGIGVLHVLLLPDNQLATFGELAYALRGDDLSVVVTYLMHLVEERLDAAVKGFQRHRADEVGEVGETKGLQQHVGAVAAHELCAVEQGQTFFRLQGDGLPTELLQDFLRRENLALKMHFAQAEQRQHEVGQRREVTAGAERALVVNHGQHVVVEEVDETLNGHDLHAAVAVTEALHL